MTQLTVEQATQALEADAFAIVQTVFDESGEYDFEPVIVMSNVDVFMDDISYWFEDGQDEDFDLQHAGCAVTYLVQLDYRYGTESYEGGRDYWEVTASKIMKVVSTSDAAITTTSNT